MTSKISVAVILLFAALSISKSYPISRQGRQLSTGSSDISAIIGPLASTSQQVSSQPLAGNGFGSRVVKAPITPTQAPKVAQPAKQSPPKSQGNKNQGGGKGKEKDSSEEDSNEEEDGEDSQEGPSEPLTFGSYDDDSNEA